MNSTAGLLKNLKSLKELDLTLRLPDEVKTHSNFSESISSLWGLTKLSLNFSDMGEKDTEALLNGISKLSGLKDLHLNLANFTKNSNSVMAALAKTVSALGKLEVIDLKFQNNADVSSEALVNFSKSISGLKSLTHFAIRIDEIFLKEEKAILELATNLGYLYTLKEISLSFFQNLEGQIPQIGDSSISEFAKAIKQLNNLTHFYLYADVSKSVTDKSISELAGVVKDSKLDYFRINLTGSKVTKSGESTINAAMTELKKRKPHGDVFAAFL